MTVGKRTGKFSGRPSPVRGPREAQGQGQGHKITGTWWFSNGSCRGGGRQREAAMATAQKSQHRRRGAEQVGDRRIGGSGASIGLHAEASRSTVAVARSLASVLEQSFGDVEVLVGDETGAAAAAIEQADDPRVRYRHNSSPLGFAGNHEALLAQARGRYVAFLHDDDRWEPGYLEQAVRRLEASPRAGFVLTAHREVPGGAVAPHPPAGCHARPLSLLLDPRFRFLPSATVVRREALRDVRTPWPELSCGISCSTWTPHAPAGAQRSWTTCSSPMPGTRPDQLERGPLSRGSSRSCSTSTASTSLRPSACGGDASRAPGSRSPART